MFSRILLYALWASGPEGNMRHLELSEITIHCSGGSEDGFSKLLRHSTVRGHIKLGVF